MKSWLVNRDPYVMVYEIIPIHLGRVSSPINPQPPVFCFMAQLFGERYQCPHPRHCVPSFTLRFFGRDALRQKERIQCHSTMEGNYWNFLSQVHSMYLGGGFNPVERYLVKMGIFPKHIHILNIYIYKHTCCLHAILWYRINSANNTCKVAMFPLFDGLYGDPVVHFQLEVAIFLEGQPNLWLPGYRVTPKF